MLSSFDVLGPHSFSVAWTTSRFRKENPELYKAPDAVDGEATSIIIADPRAAAESWIGDTNSNLKLDFVAGLIGGKDVTWTQTPQANLTFAKFMRQVGSIKANPESWKDLYFSEIPIFPEIERRRGSRPRRWTGHWLPARGKELGRIARSREPDAALHDAAAAVVTATSPCIFRSIDRIAWCCSDRRRAVQVEPPEGGRRLSSLQTVRSGSTAGR